MGRPFAIIGLSMFVSLFFMCAIGVRSAYAVLFISVLCLALLLFVRRFRRYKALLSAAAAVLVSSILYLAFFYFSYAPATAFFNKQCDITGTVEDYPEYQYDTYYCEVKVDSVDENDVSSFKIRVAFAEEPAVKPGDTVRLKAKLKEIGANAHFSKLNYLSKGIYASAFADGEMQVIESSGALKAPRYYLADYRRALVRSLQNLMPRENAALASAVLLGEKSYISSESLENINAVGISHIICVSGLHLPIIGFALLRAMRFIRASRRFKYLFVAGFILFFMALCGFTNSVVRAGIMFLIYIFAELILAEPDSLNSLGLAAMVILLNPFSAGNIGFIFSFTATLAIILCGSRICDYLKEKWSITEKNRVVKCGFSLLEIVFISLSVNVFCLPFSVLIFGKINLIGILANVLILPLATVLLVSVALSALLGLLPLSVFGFLAYPAAFVASGASAYVLRMAHLLAGVPFSNLYAGSSYALLSAGVCLAVLSVGILLVKRRRALIATAVLMVLILCCGYGLQLFSDYSRLTLTVHALKSAVCITAHCGDDFVLIGAGNNAYTFQSIEESLFASSGSDIDYFILPSDARSVSAKAGRVCTKTDVGTCIVPENSSFEKDAGGLTCATLKKVKYDSFQTKRGIQMTYYALKFSAVHIAYKGIGVLYLNSPQADISVLPQMMQQFDYLIVNGQINDFSNIKTNAIIEITAKKEADREQELQQSGFAYFTSAAQRDIHIILSQNHSEIGSSNSWQP